MKIFLIGMPGVGKSSLGKKLANRLQLSFLDLDQRIEENYKSSISSIFEQQGEHAFRQLETDQLKDILLTDDFVLACGGGTPCFHQNLEWMKEAGIVLHLTLPKESLLERISKSNNRPLFASLGQEELGEKVDELWNQRVQYFNQADIEFSTFGVNSARLTELVQSIEEQAR